MPVISFGKRSYAPIQVASGSNLMKSLLDAGLPVASSCHGDGVCAKCRIQILQGQNSLSSIEETEKFLLEKYQLKADIRISCQVQVFGDVEIDTTYW
ncbi:MAG: hypothetical protein COT73_05325 [Bdellovibrio sp. CG10_big_fil_rev_8_21_14_0_10_47_8]|nr:MAG: hypothetical protein COT73_05325 [Bdellovibrio sp. CG10_big_fil_rev_8_21_14_0_10_47_8]